MKHLKKIKFFKNINDIANIPTDYGNDLCLYKNGNIISNDHPIDPNYNNWKKNNPDAILLKGMGLFKDPNVPLICPKIFFDDLIEICNHRNLDILLIKTYIYYDKCYAMVLITEKDFEVSDGMPFDVCQYYINYIKSEFNKKQRYYLSKYKFRHRDISENLYSVVRESYDKNDGTIKFYIDIKL